MKLLLQREISRDQNSTGNSPAPTIKYLQQKRTSGKKTVLRQKHVLNVTLKDI